MAKLFYDDEYDALSRMIADSEREFKQVAMHLRTDLNERSAYAWLKNVTNPKGDEKMKWGHLVAAMQFCDRYDPLYHLCDVLGFARPERITKEDELARLLRTWEEHQRGADKLSTRIAQLRSAA